MTKVQRSLRFAQVTSGRRTPRGAMNLVICAMAVIASGCSEDKTSATDAAVDARFDGTVLDAGEDVLGAPLAVSVIRGDPTQTTWWDLTVRGVTLQAYEGALVTVRLGRPDRPPERIGSGQARVANGEFSLTFPQVWETDFYKSKTVWIDVDGNGKCDYQVDRVFHDARAVVTPELYVGDAAPVHVRMRLVLTSDQSDLCEQMEGRWPAE